MSRMVDRNDGNGDKKNGDDLPQFAVHYIHVTNKWRKIRCTYGENSVFVKF